MTNVDKSHIRYLFSLVDDFLQDIKPKYIGKEVRLTHTRGYYKHVIEDVILRKGELCFKVCNYLEDGTYAGSQMVHDDKIIWMNIE